MKLPRIICIDGLDGSGKKTISEMLRRYIQSEHHKSVYIFDPPFYLTPTGKIVQDYLYNGYGEIRDRILASLLYTVDRTMHLKAHFQHMMEHDYIIMNRSMLSNLFFNTSLRSQSQEDDWGMDHCPNTVDGIPLGIAHSRYHVTLDPNEEPSIMQLNDIHNWLKITNRDNPAHEPLREIYHYIRTMLIRDHANLLYELEVRPWWVHNPDNVDEDYLPFANVMNFVLLPMDSIGFCIQNVSHRREEDGSGNDRNERSSSFLSSVRENIMYISYNFETIFGSNKFAYWGSGRVWRMIDQFCNFKDPPIPYREIPMTPVQFTYPEKAFRFQTVYTTKMKEGVEVQRDIDAIFVDILGNILHVYQEW